MSKRINKSEGWAAAHLEILVADGIDARAGCPVKVVSAFPEAGAFMVNFPAEDDGDSLYFRVHAFACDENGELL